MRKKIPIIKSRSINNFKSGRRIFMASFKKIICALDLAEHSKEVASYASMLAKLSDASVIALYVAPTMTQYTGFHVPPNSIDSFVSEIVDGAKATMEQFMKENFSGINVSSDIVIGYAAEEILACADREGADLIVMGTHGRTGIDRMLFGSVAEKVVKNSPIPVLTIRPKA